MAGHPGAPDVFAGRGQLPDVGAGAGGQQRDVHAHQARQRHPTAHRRAQPRQARGQQDSVLGHRQPPNVC